MKSGTLRHFVTQLRLPGTQDALGQPVQTWQQVDQFWASVEPLNGKEFFGAEHFVSGVDTTITLRYKTDVLPQDRISAPTENGTDSMLFDVLAVVQPKLQERELVLLCRHTQ
jgi:SPP1 family predicted phage head-tail adaptor